jgi:hypothetical protein
MLTRPVWGKGDEQGACATTTCNDEDLWPTAVTNMTIDGRTERVIPFSQGVLIEQKIPILVHSPTVEGPPAGIGGSASSVPRRVAPSVSEPKIPMSPAML